MTWSDSQPWSGDIIRTRVSFYWHYGIYSDDDCVIQFGPPDGASRDPEEIRVLVTDIDSFRGGGEVETAELSREEQKKRRRPDKTVELALSRVGEGGYNILHNNCEHFANECVFGSADSSLVDSVREAIRKKLSK